MMKCRGLAAFAALIVLLGSLVPAAGLVNRVVESAIGESPATEAPAPAPASPRVVIAEGPAGGLASDDKLVTQGGVTPSYLIACYNGGGQKPSPADYLPAAIEGWESLPLRADGSRHPLVLNLSWFGVRTVSVVRAAGDVDPVRIETWAQAGRTGKLDYARELAHIRPLGEAITTWVQTGRGARYPNVVLINDETGPDCWRGEPEVWAAIRAVCLDKKAKLPADIADLAQPEVFEQFAKGWQADPNYDRHQAGWKAFAKTLTVRAYRACLLEAGVINAQTELVISFVAAPKAGGWLQKVELSGGNWSVGKSSLATGVRSNWQYYRPGREETRRLIALSQSVNFLPTLHAGASVDDLAARLMHCPDGCVLFFDWLNARDADRHLPVLEAYTALNQE